jgi:hypothetical protein
MPMTARVQRLARGWLVGLVATTVAAVSHSLAGGYRPGILSFGVGLIFAGMLGTAVIGTKPSLLRLAGAVAGAQLAFHLLFSLLGTGTSAGSAGSVGSAGAAGAAADMQGMTSMGTSPAALLTMTGHDHLTDPGMWAAHAVAAALTILFLRHAELAVWGMLGRLGHVIATRLTLVLAPVRVEPSTRVLARAAVVLGPVERLLISSASRRGPPLLAF